MSVGWHELTKMVGGRTFIVERVRVVETDIAVEGSFELPAVARLPDEDQVFIGMFIKTHGSIKQMETLFGVSYPTIKNRLNRIASQLDFVEVSREPMIQAATPRGEILEQLDRGELTVEQALELLKGGV